MANQTVVMCAGHDGASTANLIYDDFTGLIGSFMAQSDNDGTWTATLADMSGNVVAGPIVCTNGQQQSSDISLLGALMVTLGGLFKYPFLINVSWAA